MVLQVSSSSAKKLRQWQMGHVWLIWRFRGFYKLENEAMKAKNKDMKRHWEGKRTHIGNKIKDHEQRAPKEIHIKEFTQTVLKMIAQGKYPKQIIKELYGKK